MSEPLPPKENCPNCGAPVADGHLLTCKTLGLKAALPPGVVKLPAKKPDLKVIDADAIPTALREKRAQIREMMQLRCAMKDSPIPQHLAIRCADWVFLLALFRGRERIKAGKPAYPDNLTLQNDIARSAESVETVIMCMQEEAREEIDGTPRILTPSR